jgi:hypothetical protein
MARGILNDWQRLLIQLRCLGQEGWSRANTPHGRAACLRATRPGRRIQQNGHRWTSDGANHRATPSGSRRDRQIKRRPRLSNMRKALKLIEAGDVWERRASLQKNLAHDFAWFVNKFDLTDQIGRPIL